MRATTLKPEIERAKKVNVDVGEHSIHLRRSFVSMVPTASKCSSHFMRKTLTIYSIYTISWALNTSIDLIHDVSRGFVCRCLGCVLQTMANQYTSIWPNFTTIAIMSRHFTFPIQKFICERKETPYFTHQLTDARHDCHTINKFCDCDCGWIRCHCFNLPLKFMAHSLTTHRWQSCRSAKQKHCFVFVFVELGIHCMCVYCVCIRTGLIFNCISGRFPRCKVKNENFPLLTHKTMANVASHSVANNGHSITDKWFAVCRALPQQRKTNYRTNGIVCQ